MENYKRRKLKRKNYPSDVSFLDVARQIIPRSDTPLVSSMIFTEWKSNCRGAFHRESVTLVRFRRFHRRFEQAAPPAADNSAKSLQLAGQSV